MVRGELLSPAGATWTVEVGVHGRFHGRRTGVVLPASGPVSLGWLLGLTGDQDPDAGEDVWAELTATGKPVVSHIPSSPEAVATGWTRGAAGAMCSAPGTVLSLKV